MEVAIVEFFAPLHFEVWITEFVEVGAGIGDVFDTREEALGYATESGLPVLDLTDNLIPMLEGDDLRIFLGQYLEISPVGGIIRLKAKV